METPPILVIAPHPDDECLGCGGTVRHLTASGISVDVVFMTRGELGVAVPETATPESKQEMARTRSEEAGRAWQALGGNRMWFLDGTDGATTTEPRLADALVEVLERYPYQRVFCPWPGEAHADHRATFAWFQVALGRINSQPDVWLYEVWTPMIPNTFVPIGPTIGAKQAAIECHRSQLEMLDYRAGFLGLSAYRALFCPSSNYAEAFQVHDAATIRQMRLP